MNARHGVPPGYTPPVTVACWRCRRYLDNDPAATGHEVIRVAGRNVTVHKAGDVECVPTPYPPHRAAIPASKETP